tara:strand:- start:81 stop:302 length:222 start_codon:yes stop_codon:yes gene_type:complete
VSPENEYEIGDLIIFLNNNVLTMNNKVGIIIGTQVMTVFQEESLNKTRWYIALFGAMKLIVSEEMIQKLEFPT